MTMFRSSPQLREVCYHFVDIGHYARVVVTIDILDHSGTINHKGCALWHTAHAQSDLRKKRLVNGVVDARDAVLIVAQKRHRDSFFPGPGFLRKRIISADSVDRRVHLGVDGEVGADATHFRRARARTRHWVTCEEGA